MRKSDINSMADIARLILENASDAENLSNTADNLYNQEGQNLRLNDYKDGSKNIVMFYTKKPSDTENDVLHNEKGPAVVFANASGEYDKSDYRGEHPTAFFFKNNERVENEDEITDILNASGIEQHNPGVKTDIFYQHDN